MRVALFIGLMPPKYSFYALSRKYGFFATVKINVETVRFIECNYVEATYPDTYQPCAIPAE